MLPFLTQLWLFATPIVYPSSLVPAAVAAAVRPQPDGGRRGRVQVGAARQRSPGPDPCRVGVRRACARRGWRPLLPADGTSVRRYRLSGTLTTPAIRLIGVGKRYRRGLRREGYRTLREAVSDGVRALTASGARGAADAAAAVVLLGAPRRVVRRAARIRARPDRRERRRQEHAAQDPLARHRAHRGAGAVARARRLAARGRDRISPGADRARERAAERRDSRDETRRRSWRSSTPSSRSPRSSRSSTRR